MIEIRQINKGLIPMKQVLAVVKTFSVVAMITASALASAQDRGLVERGGVLTIDPPIPSISETAFPNNDNRHPDQSDFKVLTYVTMSSERGERWVTLTVENNSSGQRFLQADHIMAIFADGSRKHPNPVKIKFEGKEKQSLNLNFGLNKFPILSVYSSSK